MKITAQQFVSNDKDKNTFVSVFKHYSNLTEKKISKEGDLYALLSISGSKNLSAERVSKFVWDGLVDGYLYSNAKTTNESLKDSIKEGIRKIKDLIRNDQTLEEEGVNINFVVIAQKKEGLYLGNLGENDIYVYKDNRFINIYDVLKEKRSSTAGIALAEDDILLISTAGLLTEGMATFIGHKNKQEVLESLEKFGEKILNSEGIIYFQNTEEGKDKVKNIEIKADILKDIPKPRIKMPKLEKKKFKIPINFKPLIGRIVQFLKETSFKTKSVVMSFIGNQHWFKKVSSKISENKVFDRRESMKGMKIDGYKEKNVRVSRIRTVVIVVLVIILLAVGINFTINAKKGRERHNLAEEGFTKIEKLLDKAETDMVVDTSSAELSVYQTEKLFETIPSELNDDDSAKLQGLKDRKLYIEDTLFKRKAVSEGDGSITSYIDSRLSFGEGSAPSDIEIYTDKSSNAYLLVADLGLKSVFRVSLYDKKVEKIADTEGLIKEPKYISVGNKGVYVYDAKEGVLKASFDGSKVKTFAKLSGLGIDDIEEKDITEMIVLTESDNVYLLSRAEKVFLKSSFSDGNSYSLSYGYIRNDSFATVNDISSDLSLYFLTSDAGLLRYSYSYFEQKQALSPLTTGGFDGNYGNLTKGYTTVSLDYSLYLFDAQGKRFLKFEKPQEGGGEILHPGQILLKNQIIYRGTKDSMWSDVKDFVVDSKESSMYVLDGSTIWKIVL